MTKQVVTISLTLPEGVDVVEVTEKLNAVDVETSVLSSRAPLEDFSTWHEAEPGTVIPAGLPHCVVDTYKGIDYYKRERIDIKVEYSRHTTFYTKEKLYRWTLKTGTVLRDVGVQSGDFYDVAVSIDNGKYYALTKGEDDPVMLPGSELVEWT